MRTENIKTESLIPYAHNAKEHPAWHIDQIAASIEQFGFNDPVGVWTNPEGGLEIVEGHGRVLAAKQLGIERVPVIRLDHLDDEGRRAYTHIHNQINANTGNDWAVLADEIAAMPDIDWEKFGFNDDEPPEKYDPETVVEDEPTETAEPRTKPGDLWAMGPHILKCGDASKLADMQDLFGDSAPSMVFTDPPYGVAIGSKNQLLDTMDKSHYGTLKDNIKGDTLDAGDLSEMLRAAFANLRSLCADHCSYYISSPQGGELFLMMLETLRAAGLPARHILIWVKNIATFSVGRLDYDYRHEPIIYTWTKSHKFYGGYSNSVIEDAKPLEKMSKAELKDELRAYRDGSDSTVIHVDKPLSSGLHPTMKPVRLVARFIYNSSKEGDTIADIFAGSGTTAIAAEQLGRRARLMELDPHYCDVILARYEKFTGSKAELLSRAEQ